MTLSWFSVCETLQLQSENWLMGKQGRAPQQLQVSPEATHWRAGIHTYCIHAHRFIALVLEAWVTCCLPQDGATHPENNDPWSGSQSLLPKEHSVFGKLRIYERTHIIWVSHRTYPHNQALENTYISVRALRSSYYLYKQSLKSWVEVTQIRLVNHRHQTTSN